jgi:hypothetical protein
MLEIPRTQGFLYCITLKFGVYIICSFDVFSSIFVCFSLGLVLLNPNIIAETNSHSDILWTRPESMPSLRAHLLLAAITLVMGIVGMMGVRSVSKSHVSLQSHCRLTKPDRIQVRKHGVSPGPIQLASHAHRAAHSTRLRAQQVAPRPSSAALARRNQARCGTQGLVGHRMRC